VPVGDELELEGDGERFHIHERTNDCGHFRTANHASIVTVDTPGRLLRLLVLFSSRPSWSAVELTDRLEVTERTLRRDVTRLRDLGYPIESTTGRYGGYALGAGGRLPPLLLDDDEAVAVSVGLREISRTADPALGEAALSAFTKLTQVLPSGLRQRVDTLGDVAIHIGGARRAGATIDVTVLMLVARACRQRLRLRFDYRRGDDQTGRRHVEPYRLVSVSRRWYLVAFDLDRDGWRSFRVDRVSAPVETGQRAGERAEPDAAAFVTSGLAVGMFATSALIRVHARPPDVARMISPTIGVIETTDPDADATLVRIGGEYDWIARFVVGLDPPFDVVEPEELRSELRRLARRLLRTHRTGPS